MSFTSKNLQTTRRGGLSVLKGATLFFLGISAVMFLTQAFEIVPSARNAKQYIQDIIFTTDGYSDSSQTVTINGSGGNAYFSGNVGIGTGTPGYKLEVNGTGKFDGVCLGGDCRSTWPTGGIVVGGESIWNTGASNVAYYNSGNVGIGTGTPGYKLEVNGTGSFDGVCLGGDCRSTWPTGGIAVSGDYYPLAGNSISNPVTGDFYMDNGTGSYTIEIGTTNVIVGTPADVEGPIISPVSYVPGMGPFPIMVTKGWNMFLGEPGQDTQMFITNADTNFGTTFVQKHDEAKFSIVIQSGGLTSYESSFDFLNDGRIQAHPDPSSVISDDGDFITKGYLDANIDSTQFVTIGTVQTITGQKVFTGDVYMQGGFGVWLDWIGSPGTGRSTDENGIEYVGYQCSDFTDNSLVNKSCIEAMITGASFDYLPLSGNTEGTQISGDVYIEDDKILHRGTAGGRGYINGNSYSLSIAHNDTVNQQNPSFQLTNGNAVIGYADYGNSITRIVRLGVSGFVYDADYSGSYTARSLIDKGYADATYLTALTAEEIDPLSLHLVGNTEATRITGPVRIDSEKSIKWSNYGVPGNLTMELYGYNGGNELYMQVYSGSTKGSFGINNYVPEIFYSDGISGTPQIVKMLGHGLEEQVDMSSFYTGTSLVNKDYVDAYVDAHSSSSSLWTGDGTLLTPVQTGEVKFQVGKNASASGNYSVAIGGYGTEANGNYSVAMGLLSVANGVASISMGNDNEANGDSSFAMGDATQANGVASVAMGNATQANGDYSLAMGKYNIGYADSLFEIGIGTDVGSEDNIMTVYSSGLTVNGFAQYNTTGNMGTNDEAFASKWYVDTNYANINIYTGLTLGYVPYRNGSIFTNSYLFATGGMIGLGITTPEYALDVSGAIQSNDAFYLTGGTIPRRITLSGDNLSFQAFTGGVRAEKWQITP